MLDLLLYQSTFTDFKRLNSWQLNQTFSYYFSYFPGYIARFVYMNPPLWGFITVIELSAVQFGLNFKISNHKYDFRPKLHDPKFNYHFIRSILKSHNLIA